MCKRQADGYFLPIHLSGWWDTNANYAPIYVLDSSSRKNRRMSGLVKVIPSPVSMGVAKLKRSLEDIPQLKSLDATAVPV